MSRLGARTVQAAQAFLREADARGWTLEEFAQTQHRTPDAVAERMRKYGVSWSSLKFAERQRRIEELEDRPGRLLANELYAEFGFADSGCFGRFFKMAKGVCFREWQQERQAL